MQAQQAAPAVSLPPRSTFPDSSRFPNTAVPHVPHPKWPHRAKCDVSVPWKPRNMPPKDHPPARRHLRAGGLCFASSSLYTSVSSRSFGPSGAARPPSTDDTPLGHLLLLRFIRSPLSVKRPLFLPRERRGSHGNVALLVATRELLLLRSSAGVTTHRPYTTHNLTTS